MKVMYKYEINAGLVVSIPLGAILRHAEHQAGQLCLWAEVDPEASQFEQWEFLVAGTGHVLPDDWAYFNSWQDGEFVWHLFCRVVGNEGVAGESPADPAAA